MRINLSDEKTLRRLLLVTLVALCAAAAFVVSLLVGDDGEKEPSKPVPTASLPSGEPKTPTQPADPGTADAAKVASAAVHAYTTWSFKDPGPNGWMKRLEPFVTDNFHHELADTFPIDAETKSLWEGEVVAYQREERSDVTEVHPSGMHTQSATKVVLSVYYKTSTRTEGQDWSVPREEMSKFVWVEKTPKGWLVSDIRETSDRNVG